MTLNFQKILVSHPFWKEGRKFTNSWTSLFLRLIVYWPQYVRQLLNEENSKVKPLLQKNGFDLFRPGQTYVNGACREISSVYQRILNQ